MCQREPFNADILNGFFINKNGWNGIVVEAMLVVNDNGFFFYLEVMLSENVFVLVSDIDKKLVPCVSYQTICSYLHDNNTTTRMFYLNGQAKEEIMSR